MEPAFKPNLSIIDEDCAILIPVEEIQGAEDLRSARHSRRSVTRSARRRLSRMARHEWERKGERRLVEWLSLGNCGVDVG